MIKESLTTSEQNFTFSLDSPNNETKLLELVRNLELELGYHSIALKKAEQMINIVTNDNNTLRKENESLNGKCKKLELQIIKYENEINRGDEFSYSPNNIELFSPKLKPNTHKDIQSKIKNKSQNISNMTNRSKNYSTPATPLLNKTSMESKQNENNLSDLLENSLETKTPKYNKPNYMKEDDCDSERINKNVRKRKSLFPMGQSHTLSFIPLKELYAKTKGN